LNVCKVPTRTSGPFSLVERRSHARRSGRLHTSADALGDRTAQRLRAPLPLVTAGDVRRHFFRALPCDYARGAQHGATPSGRDSGQGAALVRLARSVFRDPCVERKDDAGAVYGMVRGPAVLARGRTSEDRDAENQERLHDPTMQPPDPVSQLRSRFGSCSFQRTISLSLEQPKIGMAPLRERPSAVVASHSPRNLADKTTRNA